MYAREKKENGRRLRLMKRRLKANGVVTTKKAKRRQRPRYPETSKRTGRNPAVTRSAPNTKK